MGPIEAEEFDPSVHPAEYVTADRDEDLQSILAKVEDAWTRSPNVVLVIPRGTRAFLVTHDFLALGKLQGSREVRVAVASLDPTIGGLARVLGFHMEELPEGHPVLLEDPATGSSTTDMEKPTSPLPLPALGQGSQWIVSSALPTPTSTTTSTWLNHSGDLAHYDTGSLAWGAYPSQSPHPSQPLRADVPPARPRPRHTGRLNTPPLLMDPSTVVIPDEDGPAPFPLTTTQSGRIKVRRVPPEQTQGRRAKEARRFHWGRVVSIVTAVLTLSLILSAVYAYVYLPEGTVTVTPRNKPINGLTVEVPVLTAPSSGKRGIAGVAAPSRQEEQPGVWSAPSVPATLIEVDLEEEGTRPASGSRQVPRGRAQGTMRFTNRTSSPVPVPAGLRFTGPNGVIVQTAQGGTVPATDFNSQSFGTLSLPIIATVEGPAGNLAAGQLTGVYDGTLNYVSSAMSGGSVETIKVVSQEDVDALVADLRSKAESRVGSAVLGKVTSEQQLITQTMDLANVVFEAEPKAGEDAEAVRVRLRAKARAYAFKMDDLREAVAQAVLDWVQVKLPATAGPSLDFSSIQISTPTVRSVEANRVVYTLTADARVHFSLTPELQRQIAFLVKDQELSKARDLIIRQYGDYVTPMSVQARLLWFDLGKLPADPERIEVQTRSSSGTSSTGVTVSGKIQYEPHPLRR